MKNSFQENPEISHWYEELYAKARIRGNRWFLVGALSLILAALAVTAVLVLTPLKTVMPYVIQVEDKTGMTRVLEPLGEPTLTEHEALAKFFLVKYLIARETYDPQDLNHNYEQVRMMSSPEEAVRFETTMRGKDNPLERYQAHTTRRINVRSVAFLNAKTAQVRFSSIEVMQSNAAESTQHWIATLTYRYVNAPLEEAARMNNPLGFQIQHYRIDQEVVP